MDPGTSPRTGARANPRTLAVVAILAFVALAGCSAIGGLSGAGTQQGPGLVTDGETLTLEPEPGQTVEGRTDLQAGKNVAIRLKSSGEDPFLKSKSATVENGGTFSTEFDMAGVDPGTEFEVTVSHNGTTVIEADGRVAA